MRRILTRFQGRSTGVVVTWNDLFNSQGVPSLTGLKLVAYGSRLTRPRPSNSDSWAKHYAIQTHCTCQNNCSRPGRDPFFKCAHFQCHLRLTVPLPSPASEFRMKPIFHRPPGTITFRSSIHCCGRLSSFIHCRSIGGPSSAFILLLFNRPASPRSFVVVQSFGSWQANLTTHALHISGATQLIAHLAVSVFRHIWMIDGCDRVDRGKSL